MQKLRATVDFPLTEHFERLAIEHEDAARAVAVRIPERANVNRFRTAVDGMRTGIIGARKNFFRLNHFDDLRFPRVWLCINDVNPGGPQPRYDQISSFDVRMRRVR